MSRQVVTEADLHAYIDGVLPLARAAEVEAYLAERPEEVARLAAYREQRAALRREFDPVLDELPPPRLRVPRPYWLRPLLRYAAVLGGFTLGAALVVAAAIPSSRAQAPAPGAPADDAVRFKIQAGGRDLYKLAVPIPLGDKATAQTALEVMQNDLTLSGFFKVIDPKATLANLQAEQLTINPQDWRNVGAAGVVKARATPYGNEVKYEFRLFEVSAGDQPGTSRAPSARAAPRRAGSEASGAPSRSVSGTPASVWRSADAACDTVVRCPGSSPSCAGSTWPASGGSPWPTCGRCWRTWATTTCAPTCRAATPC